jgi:hypothetical protein
MMAENFLEKHSEDLTTISEGQSRPMTINDSKNDIIRLWLEKMEEIEEFCNVAPDDWWKPFS